jgi:hypothetical protein
MMAVEGAGDCACAATVAITATIAAAGNSRRLTSGIMMATS